MESFTIIEERQVAPDLRVELCCLNTSTSGGQYLYFVNRDDGLHWEIRTYFKITSIEMFFDVWEALKE